MRSTEPAAPSRCSMPGRPSTRPPWALVTFLNASFQTVQSWRHLESPVGSFNARDNRYPGIFVAGPIGRDAALDILSASGYTDRNFVLASRDTLLLRGQPVEAFDTLSSQGGLSDLRAAVAWRQSRAVQWGLALHMITGSNRIFSHRAFADSTYSEASERFNYSYLGWGVSAGVLARIGRFVTLSGMVRADNRIRIELDTVAFRRAKLPSPCRAGPDSSWGEPAASGRQRALPELVRRHEDPVSLGGVESCQHHRVLRRPRVLHRSEADHPSAAASGVRHATLPFPLAGREAQRDGHLVRHFRSGSARRARRTRRRAAGGLAAKAVPASPSGPRPRRLGVSVRPVKTVHLGDLRLPDERGRLRADARACWRARVTSATDDPDQART